MALPKQVEQDLREIEELEKQMQARNTPQPVSEETTEETAETVEEVVEDEAPKEPVKEEPKLKAVEETVDDFKQKYNTLRGKYDAEVPRLHQQVRDLTSQINDLKQSLERKAEAEAETKNSLVTDADREEFGEELLDVQRRIATEVASKYETKIAKLEQTIASLQGQYGEMSFEQKLAQIVPDFQQVNNDPRWVAWLNEHDPLVRGPRRVLAQQAFEQGDAEAVADYVKLFKTTLEPVAKEESPRQAELEKQVTPSRTATATPTPKDTGKKVYTEAEAEKAWNKVRMLNTSGRYDDALKLEAEITAAYVEGRVR